MAQTNEEFATLAELKAGFEALKTQNERLQDITTQLLARPTPVEQTRQVEQEPEFEIDLRDLDPSAENYGKKLNKRIGAAIKDATQRTVGGAVTAAVQATRTEQARNDAYNAVWNEFQAAYPDLAVADEIVQSVAGQILGEVAANGLDVEKYLFGGATKTRFFEAVAAGVEARLEELGVVREAEEDEEDGGQRGIQFVGGPLDNQRHRSHDDAVDDAGRTMGVFDGSRQPGVPRGEGRGVKTNGNASDLAAEIREVQGAMGLFGPRASHRS